MCRKVENLVGGGSFYQRGYSVWFHIKYICKADMEFIMDAQELLLFFFYIYFCTTELKKTTILSANLERLSCLLYIS